MRVLAVGVAVLDVINEVDGYPQEDAEIRALAQDRRTGGNALNMLSVLRQFGHECHWAGTLATDDAAQFIERFMIGQGIEFQYARRLQGKVTPVSYITLNRRNGSRTIIHYRDLPELMATDFNAVETQNFDWVHFEGRNPDELVCMMDRVRQAVPHIKISLEVEKVRPGIEAAMAQADVIFFSRPYCLKAGYEQAGEFLEDQARLYGIAQELICTWGGQGAYVYQKGVGVTFVSGETIEVVDTLAAGDTFIAGYLHAASLPMAVPARLNFANRLAGLKCTQRGLAGLAQRMVLE